MKDLMPAAKVMDEALLRDRRRKLVDVATTLFMQHGFHKTSVQDLAQALGWQKGTLYLYFSRKEDILFLVGKEILEDQLSSLKYEPDSSRTSLETLTLAVRSYYQSLHRGYREVSLLYRESASALPEHRQFFKDAEIEIRQYFIKLIQAGIDAHEYKCVMSIELFAHHIVVLGHMWALKNWAFIESVSSEEFIESQIKLLLSGLPATSA